MPSDDLPTMYGNPLSEFLMFLLDFIVFTARSIYFLLETFILTILPNRYRKLKVGANHTSSTHFSKRIQYVNWSQMQINNTDWSLKRRRRKNGDSLQYLSLKLVFN